MITQSEIIDTAVKIGLGSAITGLITYFLTKLNHKKERLNKRSGLLESVTEQVARFNHAAYVHYSVIAEWTKFNEEGMTEENKTEMIKRRLEVVETSEELTSAQSKLLLLGERRAHELLSEYRAALIIFRHDSVIQEKWTTKTLMKYWQNMNKMNDAFFEELNKAYSREKPLQPTTESKLTPRNR